MAAARTSTYTVSIFIVQCAPPDSDNGPGTESQYDLKHEAVEGTEVKVEFRPDQRDQTGCSLPCEHQGFLDIHMPCTEVVLDPVTKAILGLERLGLVSFLGLTGIIDFVDTPSSSAYILSRYSQAL